MANAGAIALLDTLGLSGPRVLIQKVPLHCRTSGAQDPQPRNGTKRDDYHGTEGGTELGAELGTQDNHGTERDVTGESQEPVGQEDPALLRASSSSSLDEAVVGTAATSPPVENRAHQQLPRQVAKDLGLQVEELQESGDPVVDILKPEGPSRVAVPLIKTIQATTKTLWQTLRLFLQQPRG